MTNRIAVLGVAVIVIAGSFVWDSEQKPQTQSETQKSFSTATTPTAFKVQHVNGAYSTLLLTEVCYDGILYITTQGGGITAKLTPFSSTSAHAGVPVQCK